eukprot:TRINITY_DN109322_c0_g1_i1.p1 TRINITY_DN109322_c0_g1~~TRINITY_DN109322_c0_g1_i1.p1  ORF type:complete len:296 (-),score=44.89 TRINITY_DN109322_c0_g1_i1:62-949(-)
MLLTQSVLQKIGAVLSALLAIYFGWRSWYLSTPGLRSLLFFRSCPLLAKEVLVHASSDRFQVLQLTFGLPDNSTELDLNIAVGEHIKIRSNGLFPFARSYSPVAIRPGEFDLIVKVYPPTFGYKTPAFVSHHLSTLQIGDTALLSAPYPPPFQTMKRDVARKVGIIAFGVGITEAIGVVSGLPASVEAIVLLWALRDRQELYAGRLLEELQAKKKTSLTIKHYFSAEAGRRLDVQALREIFPWTDGSAEDQRFLAVGTKTMMKDAYALLNSAAIPYRKLLKKKFGIRAVTDASVP